MLRLLKLLFVFLRSRRELLLENLALRQQLAVLKAGRSQPRLAVADKLFWVMLRRLWPEWKRVLVSVPPRLNPVEADLFLTRKNCPNNVCQECECASGSYRIAAILRWKFSCSGFSPSFAAGSTTTGASVHLIFIERCTWLMKLLVRWARRKYKGFKKHLVGAWDWLERFRSR